MIPRSSKGPHNGEGFPRRSVAKKENLDRLGFAAAKLQRSSATSRRSHCSQHGKLLCFVLFRYSIISRTYRTNEDPISVYKGPFMLKM